MKKLVISILVVWLFTVGVFATEKRITLVIGNATYPEVGQLLNPLHDAELMASTLTDLGFEVTRKTDVSLKEMKRAIRAFGGKLDEAGNEGVGLFYYAGHGLQLDGTNYIIPVDAAIDRRGDVDIEAIDMASVLSIMEYSRSRLNFVILDACRNNPYTRGFRSATRGLAQMDSPTGSLIAYSTSPGSLAADGEDRNSPYTKALASAMRLKKVEVERMFRIVRNNVRKLTNNAQTPWESSSLTGDSFYFNQTEATASVKEDLPVAPKVDVGVTTNLELEIWNAVADSEDPLEIQSYIDIYPNGHFVVLARIRLKKLQKEESLVIASVDDTRKIKNESASLEDSTSENSLLGVWRGRIILAATSIIEFNFLIDHENTESATGTVIRRRGGRSALVEDAQCLGATVTLKSQGKDKVLIRFDGPSCKGSSVVSLIDSEKLKGKVKFQRGHRMISFSKIYE